MSKREKVLSAIVGGIIVLLLNLFLISFFLRNNTRLRVEGEDKARQLAQLQLLFADRELWEKRDAWLQARLQRLDNEQGAGIQLLNQVTEAARKHGVLVVQESRGIATPERRPYATAIRVDVDVKGSWKAMIAFLKELQGPEEFIALESTNLRVDSADATQMHAKLRVAKWYAPRGT